MIPQGEAGSKCESSASETGILREPLERDRGQRFQGDAETTSRSSAYVHGLAGPRRTNQQDVMASGRRDLERTLGVRLSTGSGRRKRFL